MTVGELVNPGVAVAGGDGDGAGVDTGVDAGAAGREVATGNGVAGRFPAALQELSRARIMIEKSKRDPAVFISVSGCQALFPCVA